MTNNRPLKKLGEICSLQNGYAFKSGDYIEKSNTLNFRMSNIRQGGLLDLDHNKRYLPDSYIKDYESFLLKDGDIVIAMTDMATEPKILAIPTTVKTDGRKLLLNQRVGRFSIDDKLLYPDYLKFILLAPDIHKELVSRGGGGVQINLGTKDILDLQIPLPPLATQQAIVAKLDEAFASLDESIALTKENITRLDEVTKSVLDKVFEEGGWERIKFGEICSFVRGPFGGSLKKEIFKTSGYAVYEQQHAIGDYFDNIRYFVDEQKFNEMKRFELKEGDLIMSCSGTMGKIAIVPVNIKKGIINQALLKLTPSSRIFNRFLKLWMQSNDFQNNLDEYAQGAAIKNVASVAILKNIKVQLPPLPKQQEIVSYLDQVFAQTKQLKSEYEAKLQQLKELKSSILQSAFYGKLI